MGWDVMAETAQAMWTDFQMITLFMNYLSFDVFIFNMKKTAFIKTIHEKKL